MEDSCPIVFSCDQAAFHYVPIMKLSGVITNDRSDIHMKMQKVKVKTQFSRFQTVTL